MTQLLLDQSIYTKPTFYLVSVLFTCLVTYTTFYLISKAFETKIVFYRILILGLAVLAVLSGLTAFSVAKSRRDYISAEHQDLYTIKRFDKSLVLRSNVSEFNREQVVTLKIVDENDKVLVATLDDKRYILEKQYLNR